MLIRLIAMDALALLASVLVPLGILLSAARWSHRSVLRRQVFTPVDAESCSAVVARQLRRGRIAGGIVAGSVLLQIGLTWLPVNATEWYLWSFLVPLVVAVLALAALHLRPLETPVTPAGVARPLDLNPRTLWSFGRRWWFAGWLAATTLLVVTMLLAGVISGPDENGHHTLLTISVGSASASSQFLGWFYGVPLLFCVAALTAVTSLALRTVARPPLVATADARTLDLLLRRMSTRMILSVSTGAVLVTLGLVWKLIALAARMRGGVLTETAGSVEVGTSFAALATPLWAGGYLAEGLGIALLLFAVLARAPLVVRADSAPAAPAPGGAASGVRA